MTATNEVVFRCSGVTCGGVIFPAFELRKGTMCGISVPTGFGEDWILLMKTLCGEFKTPDVQLLHNGVAICPQLGCKQFSDDANVGESLKSLGFSETDYDAISANGRVDATTAVGQLPGTPRLLIDVLRAIVKPDKIVVFTTTGLDPVGIKETNRLVASSGATGLHLFATSLSSFFCQSEMFDEVVECTDTE